MKQKMNQSSVDFMTSIEVEASLSQIAVDQISNIVIQGLKPNIRQFVLGKEIKDLPSLRKWIAVADTAAVSETRDDFASCGHGHPTLAERDEGKIKVQH